MGFITKNKTNAARDAHQAGQTIFTTDIGSGMSGTGNWAEAIAEIEAEGWTLAHWAVALDNAKRLCAYPVFRRA